MQVDWAGRQIREDKDTASITPKTSSLLAGNQREK